MPRGYKVSNADTATARESGWKGFPRLQDKRSFISTTGHLILWGKDKSQMRTEIFSLNRQENDGRNRCWSCKTIVDEDAESGWPGHWHHLSNKSGERCDCPHNAVVSCPDCHREEHVRPWKGRG